MLETEIKKLTTALTRLADLMENGQRQTAEKVEAEQPEPQTEEKTETEQPDPQTAETDGEYTTDDIKSMALAISRKDRTKQKEIKTKLAEHDAKVAADLKGDGLQVVGAWLGELKEEVGA